MSVEQTRFRRSTYFLSIFAIFPCHFQANQDYVSRTFTKVTFEARAFFSPVCLRRLLIRLTKSRLNKFHRYTLYMRLLLLQVREGTYIPT